MSKTFSPSQIIRCPLCRDGGRPSHVINGVMLCESCGNRFRVVHATPGKTGVKLSRNVKERIVFAGKTEPR